MSGYAERKWRRRGEAQRHPGAHRGVHCDAVPGLDGIKARAERVDQLNMARRDLRARDAEAHLGIRHSRDQPGVSLLRLTQCQIAYKGFGLSPTKPIWQGIQNRVDEQVCKFTQILQIPQG